MKAIIKFIKQSALPFIKKNIFSCLCLLLSALVALTGSISYSKYISTDNVNKKPGAGSFSCSASIDGVSALSFTNTAFWGGTVADDKIAMNALRSINFSVNNWEVVNGEEKVTEVKTSYDLVFSAPKNFASRLAFQLFNEEEAPMLPQIVVYDLIHSVDSEGEHSYNTGTSIDYTSTPFQHIVLQTSVSADGKTYFATYNGVLAGEQTEVYIRIEEYTAETHQLLHFRTWDTSALTNNENPTVKEEGGKITPPLQVTYRNDVDFYRITISMSNLELPAGVKTTRKHSIHLSPTDTISDSHLGSSFVELVGSEYKPVTELYAPNPGDPLKDWTLQIIHEDRTDAYYTSADAFTAANRTPYELKNANNEHVIKEGSENIMGSVHVYIPGETGTLIHTDTTTVLNNATPEVGQEWVVSGPTTTNEDPIEEVRYFDKSAGWNVVDQNIAENRNNYADNKYYKVTFKIEKNITKKTVIKQGTLTTNTVHNETFKVGSVTHDPLTGHDVIELYVTDAYTITATVEGNLTNITETKYTITVDKIEERIGYYNVYFYWAETNPNAAGFPNDKINTYFPSYQDSIIEQDTGASDTIKATPFTRAEYFIRTLDRTTNRTNIQIESVKWIKEGADGVDVDEYFTEDNPFKVLDANGIQKRYLAQCYSKNYPFYVNVIFEQVQ